MHYFQFNIKSYQAATVHLTNDEDIAYRRLIEMYYDTEQPIPTAILQLSRRLRVGINSLEIVLSEFFELTEDGWVHPYCDSVITEYHAYTNKQRINGSKGGRGNKAGAKPDKPTALPDKPSAQPTTNHKPLTTNQELNTSVNSDKKPSESDPVACPVERIVEVYHDAMPNNPRCKVLNNARRASIRQRWREASTMWTVLPFGYESQPDGLTAWRKFFEVCADSDFLTGKVPGRNGAPPFVADVDFLFSPSGFAKVLENKYHREAA